MLTVFLKHDQSRPLGELKAQLAKQGFYKTFPPAGVEVVSWNIMMGIGQVVTLRLPASRLAEVNLALEKTRHNKCQLPSDTCSSTLNLQCAAQ
jgi:hypothetical protein